MLQVYVNSAKANLPRLQDGIFESIAELAVFAATVHAPIKAVATHCVGFKAERVVHVPGALGRG